MPHVFRTVQRQVIINGKVVESTVQQSREPHGTEDFIGCFSAASSSSQSSGSHSCVTCSTVTVVVNNPEGEANPSL